MTKRISWKSIEHLVDDRMPLDVIRSKNSRRAMWHIENGAFNIPVCVCGKDTKWDNTLKAYREFCSVKCSAQSEITKKKRAETSKERFGVISPTQNTVIRQKQHDTKIKKYGENYSNVFLTKAKATLNERLGVDFAHQSLAVREKFKSTMQKKYGVDYAMQSDKLKDKHASVMLEKYGITSALQCATVREKINNTMHERYGSIHALQNNNLKSKMIDTCRNRYGSDYYTQSHFSDYAQTILNDSLMLEEFAKDKSLTQIAYELGIDPTTMSNYMKKYCIAIDDKNENYFELQIKDILDSFGVQYIRNDRKQIAPMELDFYLPDHRLAIECNGVYWHCDKFKDNQYHYNKWLECNNKNIDLIQIRDIDWYLKREKFREMIIARIGIKKQVLGARKCSVSCISGPEAAVFLSKYHLQGKTTATYWFGAWYNHTLVAVMGFGWTRGSKQNRRFELKRWATDSSRSYPGLFSKVFSFSQQHINFNQVVSFSANDWFNGNMYKKAGFDFVKVTRPSYLYFYKNKLWHPSNFTKPKLAKNSVMKS